MVSKNPPFISDHTTQLGCKRFPVALFDYGLPREISSSAMMQEHISNRRILDHYLEKLVLEEVDNIIIRKEDTRITATGEKNGADVQLTSPPQNKYEGWLNHAKLRAGIDMSTRDKKQEGQITLSWKEQEIIIHVRTNPNEYNSEDIELFNPKGLGKKLSP